MADLVGPYDVDHTLHILAECPPSELIDRLTITSLKVTCNYKWRPDCDPLMQQFNSLQAAYDKLHEFAGRKDRLDELFSRLSFINQYLWDLEDESERLYKQYGPEIITVVGKPIVWAQLSFKIKRANKLRSVCKQAIDELLGSELRETKIYQ